MQIITAAQCRAARALLNWSQPELAGRCDIHVQTISNFEKESGTPSKSTLEKIYGVFLFSGVLFLDEDGVKLTKNIITIFDGPDAGHRFMDGIYNEVKDKPGTEVLIFGLTQWGEDKLEEVEFARQHVNKLLSAGVTRRLIAEEGYSNFLNSVSAYKVIPKKYFPYAGIELYNNKLVLREWGENPKIVAIEEKSFADTFRKLFNFVWDHSKPPGKK